MLGMMIAGGCLTLIGSMVPGNAGGVLFVLGLLLVLASLRKPAGQD